MIPAGTVWTIRLPVCLMAGPNRKFGLPSVAEKKEPSSQTHKQNSPSPRLGPCFGVRHTRFIYCHCTGPVKQRVAEYPLRNQGPGRNGVLSTSLNSGSFTDVSPAKTFGVLKQGYLF
ncbi:hypothetical protein AVEN_153746-1 [Araneus ventricosus]|uniref:Uncharacterized protein n=1 Tax=Araneus ventricosus TaxID=182803 RepID=A0A4Y2LEZ7_ARAVE|nr:hypothetical protein AVEN_153746-1 [Araneus ventricosus]